MTQVKVQAGANASILPASVVSQPQRGFVGNRGANSVNASPTGARASVTAAGSAQVVPGSTQAARTINPALNQIPWSTSMAQTRSEPNNARRKGMRAGKARQRQIKKGSS